ncbi:MAG: pyrroline-5-carboxylate reductase [Spirochaetaceae bacterium]|jgi:pyrroline-5-carboxylate reductase|nr:pyrroline-5-carboxylate reductase [Spirochaetaceae bacterium]
MPEANFDNTTVGFIGAGMMGGALMKAVASRLGDTGVGGRLCFTDLSAQRCHAVAKDVGAIPLESNTDLVQRCGVIFLAIKPQQLAPVVRETAPHLQGKILVSIAAGVSIPAIRKLLGGIPVPVVRLMPNLPATVGEGMIALCVDSSDDASREAADTVSSLLSRAGRVERVEERLMDCVTAVSGSGPAYGFVFIEALADAAVSLGMPRSQAYVYAAQTLRGAAAMVLETGAHPAVLKDGVCSPGGTTIEAVKALEAGGFRAAIIAAAAAAARRSVELGEK